MAEKKMMTVEEFGAYEEVTPIANYVLVEVVDKATTRTLLSGIVVNENDVTNSKPYFLVRKVSKAIEGNNLDIEVGDLVEVSGHINFFYGQNTERLALLNAGSISGVYKKKKGA